MRCQSFLQAVSFAMFALYGGNANAKFVNSNISLSVEYGQPSYSLLNPDDSESFYTSRVFRTSMHLPLFSRKHFAVNFSPSFTMAKMKNTNSGEISEQLSQEGFGAGLSLKVYSLELGVEYERLEAEHEAFGSISDSQLNYTLNQMSYFVGYQKVFGSIAIGLKYRIQNAAIPASDTGLDKDSTLSGSGLFFTLRVYSNSGIGVLGGLFEE